jgi:hypothetical protein
MSESQRFLVHKSVDVTAEMVPSSHGLSISTNLVLIEPGLNRSALSFVVQYCNLTQQSDSTYLIGEVATRQ